KETKKRVKAAIRQLGYVPNTLARSLRSRRTCTLALVLTDITNPFWTTVARGAEDTASKAGFSMMLGNTDESEEKQSRYITALLEKQIDGILFVPVGDTPAVIRMLKRQDVPVVILDRRITGAKADVVRCDSDGGAYKLTQLLLSLGHRRIAVLSGPRSISTAEDRVRGYQRAFAEHGMPIQPELMQYGGFTVESGVEMARGALTLSPRPTAIFAGNNFIAIGALKVLQEAGVRVPEDIALVGFDDLPANLTIDPFLTVARQPAYEMGSRAAELLLARLAGTAPRAFQEVVLPTEVEIHRSSGSPIPAERIAPAATAA
ncbi:MAG: LacI family DNA-binding transcriptional regulator, partial [Anaerolineales bacterium]